MATFAALSGVTYKDLEGKPMIFDSYDMSPMLFGTGECARKSWFYFTENELSPGAVRVGNYKFIFNLRGDDGAATGGLAVDTNLGWKGPEKYVATVPQIFALWADPQKRYGIFMNNFAERTWLGVVMEQELQKIMATYIKNPPRKVPRPNVDPTHTAPAITSAIPQIHIRTVASLHLPNLARTMPAHSRRFYHLPCSSG